MTEQQPIIDERMLKTIAEISAEYDRRKPTYKGEGWDLWDECVDFVTRKEADNVPAPA